MCSAGGQGRKDSLPSNPLFPFILFLSLLDGLGPSISGVSSSNICCVSGVCVLRILCLWEVVKVRDRSGLRLQLSVISWSHIHISCFVQTGKKIQDGGKTETSTSEKLKPENVCRGKKWWNISVDCVIDKCKCFSSRFISYEWRILHWVHSVKNTNHRFSKPKGPSSHFLLCWKNWLKIQKNSIYNDVKFSKAANSHIKETVTRKVFRFWLKNDWIIKLLMNFVCQSTGCF